MFELATCAQYTAELWAWFGFTLLTRGPNGLFILLVSLANLVPRSVTTHNWYLERFGGEYEALDRAYLIPSVF